MKERELDYTREDFGLTPEEINERRALLDHYNSSCDRWRAAGVLPVFQSEGGSGFSFYGDSLTAICEHFILDIDYTTNIILEHPPRKGRKRLISCWLIEGNVTNSKAGAVFGYLSHSLGDTILIYNCTLMDYLRGLKDSSAELSERCKAWIKELERLEAEMKDEN